MLKSIWLSLVFASSLVACVVSGTEEEAAEEEAAEVEVVAAERCPDLLNQVFTTPQSCIKNGQLGIKECTQVCDILRSMRISPTFPPVVTCGIDGSDCEPEVCGPCVVIDFEDPLP